MEEQKLNEYLAKQKSVIASNVTKYRKKCRMKKKDLADAANLYVDVIGKVESGQADIELLTLLKIAYGLKIPPYLLLKSKESNLDFIEILYTRLSHLRLDPKEKEEANEQFNIIYENDNWGGYPLGY